MNKSILAGRYQLGQCLASGNMSNVYEAEDKDLSRKVAVKILSSDLSKNPDFIQRFRLEAQAVAGLRHPNIVDVHDQGKDGDSYYIVMEYVKGQTLFDILRGNGKLSDLQTKSIICNIAEGLAAIHSHNIVHQDIKPGNILVSEQGEIKLADFGIAHFVPLEKSLTNPQNPDKQDTVIGTVAYFSPEQAKGEEVDARSDLYSLGIVMYEMLTGKVPFEGATPVEVAQKHLHQEPDLAHAIGTSLKNVILKLLAKDPTQRYQSAQNLLADFKSSKG